MPITVLVRKSLEQDFNTLMHASAKWVNKSHFLSDPNSFYKHVCCRFSFSNASNILLVLTCHVLIRQLKSDPRKLSIGVEVNIQRARSGLASSYYVIIKLFNIAITHNHLIQQYTRLKNLEYLSTDRIEQTVHTMNRLHL